MKHMFCCFILLLTGCRAYLGHGTYEESRDFRRENEKVIQEFHRLTVCNEGKGILAEYVTKSQLDDVCDIDTIESNAYGKRDWGFGEAILMPLRIVFGVIALPGIALGDRENKFDEHTYSLSAARHWNNQFNIFVSLNKDADLFENETIRTRTFRVSKTETKGQTITDAEIIAEKIAEGKYVFNVKNRTCEIIDAPGKQTFKLKSGENAVDELRRQIFKTPLPPRTCDVTLTYKDSNKTGLRLSSLDVIPKSEQEEWRNIEAALAGKKSVSVSQSITSLKKFMDKKLIPSQDGNKLLSVLDSMKPIKYPLGTGVKLFKDVHAGISLTHCMDVALASREKLGYKGFNAPKTIKAKYEYCGEWHTVSIPGYRCAFLYAFDRGHAIVFGVEVDVSDFSYSDIIAKYRKEFPGIKVYNDREKRKAVKRKEMLNTSVGMSLHSLDKKEFEKTLDAIVPEKYVLENEDVYVLIWGQPREYHVATGEPIGEIKTLIMIDKKHEARCAETCRKDRMEAAAKKAAEEQKKLAF